MADSKCGDTKTIIYFLLFFISNLKFYAHKRGVI